MPAPAAAPRRRLGSLKDSSFLGTPKPPPRRPAKKPTCCENPDIVDTGEGQKVCQNCYTQLEDDNIVSEVTFSEDARGAATVQGGFVNENQRYGNTMGGGVNNRIIAGERNTTQETERNARRSLDKLCPTLGIPDTTKQQAVSIFLLASRTNFSAGRRTDEVAAASLYAACRRQKDNQVMLIDISELLHMNVFRLGEVYKAMCKDIHLQESGIGVQYLVEVESLVMKYCRKLEFGEATRQVAEDAVKIVRRMKRDWMVTGRHPAGLCGACIILAARMNNFRRSTREVVYVAKVADLTVMKRVAEFRRTKAAALTVEQFREYGVRLKHQSDPPVLYETQLKQMKMEDMRRQREASALARQTAELADDGMPVPDRDASIVVEQDENEDRRKRRRTDDGQPPTPPPTQQEPRRDADGFVIPALPDQTPARASSQTPGPESDEQGEEGKRKRGRPKKAAPEPIIITEEELAEEDELEHDINENLNDEEVIDSRNDLEKAKSEERAKQLADLEKLSAAERTRARREAQGMTWVPQRDTTENAVVTAEDLEEEFADDPEVQHCLLTDVEQRVKEQIWVTHNEDWLRQQQEKKLIEAVAKSVGRNAKGQKKGTKAVKRKRKGRMGDGSTLAEATTPIETPADANRAMVERRSAHISKFLNWEALNKVFNTNSSRSTSARGSATPHDGTSVPPSPSTTDPVRQRDSVTPAQPDHAGLQSSPATQHAGGNASEAGTPVRRSMSATPMPATPPQTQAGADALSMLGDEDDYVQDDLDYGSDGEGGYLGQEDEREDIGEDDDFTNVIDSTSRVAVHGDYIDDEYY